MSDFRRCPSCGEEMDYCRIETVFCRYSGTNDDPCKNTIAEELVNVQEDYLYCLKCGKSYETEDDGRVVGKERVHETEDNR